MEIKVLKEIAEQGVPWAQGRLGAYYVNGGEGLLPSEEIGLEYLTKAACQGHKQALVDAGIMHLKGAGCVSDVDNGLHFLTEAAKKYHKDAFIHLANHSFTSLKDNGMAYYYFLIHLGFCEEKDAEDIETLSFIKSKLEPEAAKLAYADAEQFIHGKPHIPIEMLDYSGVYVSVSQNKNHETEIVISTEDVYFPLALEAAHELVERMQ